MKLVWIALFVFGFLLLAWWLEERDPDRWEAARMADRDRKAKARRRPHRRGKYSQVIMPPLLAQRRQNRGQKSKDTRMIAQMGGAVK